LTSAVVSEAVDPRPEEQAQPWSCEAEQSVLGGLLIDSSAYARVSDVIGPPDLFLHAHRLVWAAISALVNAGHPVDVVTVFDQLGDQADAVGGLAGLNALAQCVPSTANILRYSEIVAERAALRRVLAAADAVKAQVLRGESSAAVLDDAKVAFGRLAEQRRLGGSTRVPMMDLAELRAHSRAVTWLVKHVVPADSIGMLYGGSGTFKSFIALDLALHIAHGLPWLGRNTRKGAVLYIAAEGGAGLWQRIEAWHMARRLRWEDISARFRVVPVALDLTQDAWRIVEAAQVFGMSFELVVTDTFSQTYAGEENSANEVAAYFRELGTRFRALWHCSVLIIHHTGHQATERPRGSSAMRANLDYMLGVFRDEQEMLATLTCAKQKDGDAFKDATFSLSVHELGHDEDNDPITSLVARHLSRAEDVDHAMAVEQRAGRGGHHALLLKLIGAGGMRVADLRKAFCEDCGATTPEARRQAWGRARKWAEDGGYMEVVDGMVIATKAGV
jgi:hypothetical protein